jgi:hypothetical protein
MSNWRVAKSLLKLLEQVNSLTPGRSHSDDGTIGDERHQSRSSDHNPWVRDGGEGVVTAMDLTHDPRGGFDSYKFADMLKANADSRIKYIISNRRIWNPSVGDSWRPYHGANPHDHHVHISVKSDKGYYDSTAPWLISLAPKDPGAPATPNRPVLGRGSVGDDVRYLQTLLKVKVDGEFGEGLEHAVKVFQAAHGLVVDGRVGRYTWDKLLH